MSSRSRFKPYPPEMTAENLRGQVVPSQMPLKRVVSVVIFANSKTRSSTLGDA